MANKFVSFLETVGKDAKSVFAFLGSSKGQAVVQDGEAVVEDAATIAGLGAPVQNAITLINSWMTKIITTETVAAAAGAQDGTGTQKAAAVLTEINPELTQFFPGTTGAQAQTINTALVTILNTLTVTAPSTPAAPAAPVSNG